VFSFIGSQYSIYHHLSDNFFSFLQKHKLTNVQMAQKEWAEIEEKTLKDYRKTLVHKARPMPTYNFFVPHPSSKKLTSPKSPRQNKS